MRTITGNILQINDGIICHQVNCIKVAGAGLALQIANMHPKWLEEYESRDSLLGNVWLYKANDTLSIASLYAQKHIGRQSRQTSYDAMDMCAMRLGSLAKFNPLYIPYMMGCGLGGGNWNIVQAILQEYVPSAIIVKLP